MNLLDKGHMLFFFKQLKDTLGIDLNLDKEYLLITRLTPLARMHGFVNLGVYLSTLCSSPVGSLHTEAFEAMTTKETQFFRDMHVYDALKNHIFPALIEQRQSARQLSIWSAACSTGQEPYSLSMLISNCFPQLQSWNISILATDFSDLALSKAKAGVYTKLEVERGLTAKQITDNFQRLKDNQYALINDIRNKVRFEKLNLTKDLKSLPKFDLILMRNVLIYFDQLTKKNILNGLYPLMAENHGCLLLGSAESIFDNQLFKQVILPKMSYFAKVKPA